MSRKLGQIIAVRENYLDDSHSDGLRSSDKTTQLLQPYCSWLSAAGAEVSRKEGQ